MKRIELARIALLVLIVFIGLGLSEIVLRIFTNDPYKVLVEDKPISVFSSSNASNQSVNFYRESQNTLLLYEHNPNMVAVFNRTIGKESRLLTFETNSFGLRDKEYTLKKPEKTYRILVFGDSVTAGNGLNLNETVSKVLESFLNNDNELKERRMIKKFEVINFGVSGYNVVQETNLLISKGLSFSPDLIIINYVLNDVDYSHRLGTENQEKNNEVRPPACFATFLKIKIPCSLKRSLKKIRFAALLNKFITKLFNRENIDLISDLNRNHQPDSATFLQLKQSYQKISNLSLQNNFMVIVMIFPYFLSLQNYPLMQAHENVKAEAEKNNFYAIDLLKTYEKCNSAQLRITSDDVTHPNAEGHYLAALELFKNIKSLPLSSNKLV